MKALEDTAVMTSPSPERESTEIQALLHQFVGRKIEFRAYSMYEQRGRIDGQEFDDWLRAEAEVLGKNLAPLFGRA